jgi:hypothetical protein
MERRRRSGRAAADDSVGQAIDSLRSGFVALDEDQSGRGVGQQLPQEQAALGGGAAAERTGDEGGGLTASLEAQNAAVDALKAESDERTRRANAAIRKANDQAKGLRAKIARLERSKPSGDVCESARSLIIDTLREDRP